MKKIEVRALESDGQHNLEKAVAVISVIWTGENYILHIRENGELTEEWWRAFPGVLQETIEQGLKSRRGT